MNHLKISSSRRFARFGIITSQALSQPSPVAATARPVSDFRPFKCQPLSEAPNRSVSKISGAHFPFCEDFAPWRIYCLRLGKHAVLSCSSVACVSDHLCRKDTFPKCLTKFGVCSKRPFLKGSCSPFKGDGLFSNRVLIKSLFAASTNRAPATAQFSSGAAIPPQTLGRTFSTSTLRYFTLQQGTTSGLRHANQTPSGAVAICGRRLGCLKIHSSRPRLDSVSVREFHSSLINAMAKSKFEYVRQFETDDPCLQNCWLVVRIDGKAFHKFTDSHHYMKPNDERGLSLMTRAAQTVMSEFNEIVLAYGQSDEFSFVFHKNCKLYNRRASKIVTNVVSLFASSFTFFWSRFFNSQELQYPPSFDGRVVLYPSEENLKDYLSWRQADCHINNLYNTCFWKLIQEKGLTPNKSAERLKGTLSADKNEILYSEFSINYNNLPELYRKGSVLIRPKTQDSESPKPERTINNHAKNSEGKANKKPGSIVLHTDIIGKKFWEDNPHILGPKA